MSEPHQGHERLKQGLKICECWQMKTVARLKKAAQTPGDRRAHKQFVRSLKETAARAVVTATVTFGVGWVLKNMFEKSVAKAAEEGAKTGAENQSETNRRD